MRGTSVGALLLVLVCSDVLAFGNSFGWSTYFDRDEVFVAADDSVPAGSIVSLTKSLRESGHDRIVFREADERIRTLPKIRVRIDNQRGWVRVTSDVAFKDVIALVNVLRKLGVTDVAFSNERRDKKHP